METTIEIERPVCELVGPVNRVRLCRFHESESADYTCELRLTDGFLDAVETFWNGDSVTLSVVVPDEVAERLRSDIFRTPRISTEVVGLSETLGSLGAAVVAETDPISRRYLAQLGLAARDPEAATLFLGSDIFPIREFSAATLLDRAAARADGAEDYGLGSLDLFHGGAAAAWMAEPRGMIEPLVSKRRRLVLNAVVSAKLALRVTTEDEPWPPLFQTMPGATWRGIAAEGWAQQPWKVSEAPHFLRLAGAAKDPEMALSVVYGTFHR